MPTESDTTIIKAPAAKLRATRRAKRRLEISGWLWRSYMERILVPERFARRRPPPGWRRRKTLATAESASAVARVFLRRHPGGGRRQGKPSRLQKAHLQS